MRAVIQRVTNASVEINDETTARIGAGLVVLLGIEEVDEIVDVQWLVQKIISMRIFNDDQNKMNLSLKDSGGDILIVSQFTLHASTKKGNRPSFIKAARPENAIPLYEKFISETELQLGKKVSTGKFGAMMKILLINDGPVTIVIDSRSKE